jgi:hypothetical protein
MNDEGAFASKRVEGRGSHGDSNRVSDESIDDTHSYPSYACLMTHGEWPPCDASRDAKTITTVGVAAISVGKLSILSLRMESHAKILLPPLLLQVRKV